MNREEAKKQACASEIPDAMKRMAVEYATPSTRQAAGADSQTPEQSLEYPTIEYDNDNPVMLYETDHRATPENEFYWRRSLRRNTNALRMYHAQATPHDWIFDVTALGDSDLPFGNLPSVRQYAEFIFYKHKQRLFPMERHELERDHAHGAALEAYIELFDRCVN